MSVEHDKLGAYNARLRAAGETNPRIERYNTVVELRGLIVKRRRLIVEQKKIAKVKPRPAAPLPRTRYDDYVDAVGVLDKRIDDAKRQLNKALDEIKNKSLLAKLGQVVGVVYSDQQLRAAVQDEYNNTHRDCEAKLRDLRFEYRDEIAAHKRENAPELSDERKAEIEFVKQRNADREASERRNREFKVEIDSVDRAKHTKPKL